MFLMVKDPWSTHLVCHMKECGWMAGLKVLKNVWLSCTNIDCSWPFYFSMHTKEKVSPARVEHAKVESERQGNQSSPPFCADVLISWFYRHIQQLNKNTRKWRALNSLVLTIAMLSFSVKMMQALYLLFDLGKVQKPAKRFLSSVIILCMLWLILPR